MDARIEVSVRVVTGAGQVYARSDSSLIEEFLDPSNKGFAQDEMQERFQRYGKDATRLLSRCFMEAPPTLTKPKDKGAELILEEKPTPAEPPLPLPSDRLSAEPNGLT